MELTPEETAKIRSKILDQMLTFIEGRIADGFPGNLNKTVASFYDAEISPGVMDYLRAHKSKILIEAQKAGLSIMLARINPLIEKWLDKRLEIKDYDKYDE